MVPKVYLDTTVYKFSATKLPRLYPRSQAINWGGVEQEITVHDFVEINPNDNISNNPVLKTEAEILPKLANLGKDGVVKYQIQTETLIESWGIPNMDSKSGRFYGAPVEKVDAPFQYGRVVSAAFQNTKDIQFDFLSGIKHKRFEKLQRVTGAYQGPGNLHRNQLLDAFHIWCAEHNKCDYLLTLDFKLIKVIRNGGEDRVFTRLVTPSELLAVLESDT